MVKQKTLAGVQFFCAILLVGISSLVAAQNRQAIDLSALGPQIGDLVPDFNLPDQNGQLHNRDSIMGPKGPSCYFIGRLTGDPTVKRS